MAVGVSRERQIKQVSLFKGVPVPRFVTKAPKTAPLRKGDFIKNAPATSVHALSPRTMRARNMRTGVKRIQRIHWIHWRNTVRRTVVF